MTGADAGGEGRPGAGMPLDAGAVETIRRRRTTPGMVADVLRDAILRGALPAGQPLRQDELAARFGLSRIPVREALRQLEGEGLVTALPHRGATVAALSADELQELCEMRAALETAALRLAIPRLDAAALAEAEGVLRETDRAGDVLEHWSRNNWRFHAALYRPAGRPRMLALIQQLHDNVERYLRLHGSVARYREQGQAEHRDILGACRRGDADAAAVLLARHIGEVAVLLAGALRGTAAGEPGPAGGAPPLREGGGT